MVDSSEILERLIEIRKAIGFEEPCTLYMMVLEAQEYVLEAQRQANSMLFEDSGARRKLYVC
jgi:hypothetical protein